MTQREVKTHGPGNAVTGYLHCGYAASLAEFGTPRELPRSGGWVLVRPIPGSAYQDAMGCYPLFTCRNWSSIVQDVEELGTDLVSLAVVADPFGAYTPADLSGWFPDVAYPYKEHLVIDLLLSPSTFVSGHHRRYARKALESLTVERVLEPVDLLDDWVELYATLIQRWNITGMAAFSRQSFAGQLQVPGMLAFRAVYQDRTVGMLLWYLQQGVSYYHLGAYSTEGYELRASFALFWRAIEYFAKEGPVRWLSLGAGSGAVVAGELGLQDGLTAFKRGWSTGNRTAYFCGRILNQDKYRELVGEQGARDTKYFPAYRAGEFG